MHNHTCAHTHTHTHLPCMSLKIFLHYATKCHTFITIYMVLLNYSLFCICLIVWMYTNTHTYIIHTHMHTYVRIHTHRHASTHAHSHTRTSPTNLIHMTVFTIQFSIPVVCSSCHQPNNTNFEANDCEDRERKHRDIWRLRQSYNTHI